MSGNPVKMDHDIIKAADANMRLEGFIASDKVKADCLSMLNGKTTADKLVEKYISQYRK